MDALPASADVVVVGSGVIGASVAWHLARRGCRNVVLLEQAPRVGAGSTGRATGGFRAQFATPVNVALSLLAREALRRLPVELGTDGGYRPAGYLFVASSAEQLEPLRRARVVQRAAGLLDTEELTADQVLRRNPALEPEAVAGGMFCRTDGFIRPLELLDGYLAGGAPAGRAARARLHGTGPRDPVVLAVARGSHLAWDDPRRHRRERGRRVGGRDRGDGRRGAAGAAGAPAGRLPCRAVAAAADHADDGLRGRRRALP